VTNKIYHYTECGLKNQFLINGFEIVETDYGPSVFIENVEGLHYAIARSIAEVQPHISGPEFKFVRKQMGLTQKKIGEIYGCDAQTVARWEKVGRINKPADHFIRYLFLGDPIKKSAEQLASSLPDVRKDIALELDGLDWGFESKDLDCAVA